MSENEKILANAPEEAGEENLSELLQIRRDKLDALKQAGNDPYTITKYDVTAICW